MKKMSETEYERQFFGAMDELYANPSKFGTDKYGVHDARAWEIVEDRLKKEGYDGVDFGSTGVLFDPDSVTSKPVMGKSADQKSKGPDPLLPSKAVSKDGGYRYHTTSPKNLDSIKRFGLKPSNGQYGKGVYFAPSEDLTGDYGSAEGLMLRVRKEAMDDFSEWPGEQGWTEKTVPPEIIEYKTPGTSWKPLVETKKVSPKSPDAVVAKASKYKTAEEFVAAQKPLYHGTDEFSKALIDDEGFKLGNESYTPLGSKDKSLGEGVYFGATPESVSQYGDNVVKAALKPGVNIAKMTAQEVLNALRDAKVDFRDPEAVTKFFKSKGYDGIQTLRETVVFDPKNVLTSNQLLDVYRKHKKER